MLFTDTEAATAAAATWKVYPWGESTKKRELLVRALLRRWCLATQGPPAGAFILLVRKGYAPTTVLGLMMTAQRLLPSIRATQKWDHVVLWVRLKAAAHQPRKATPATPQNVAVLFEALPKRMAVATTFLFITASRYGDLRHMFLTRTWRYGGKTIVRVDLPTFKSDRFGKRSFAKTIYVPTLLTLEDIRQLLQCPPEYWALLHAVKSIYPQLSVHSFRRGAVTTLAQKFQGQEILLLTGHSISCEAREIRRYTEPAPNTTEAMAQEKMAQFLVQQVCKSLTARKLCYN